MLVPQIIMNPEESVNVSWGLGFGLEKMKSKIVFWHWGDNTTFRCFFMAYFMIKMACAFLQTLPMAYPLQNK